MIYGEPEMTPLGAVVFGACDANIHQICLHENGVGAVFVFNDENKNQHNVCRACADYSYDMGLWRRPGQPGTTSGSTAEFYAVIKELHSASTDEDRVRISSKYEGKTWNLSIPLSAGDCLERFWTASVQFPNLGWVKIGFPIKDDGAIPSTPTQVIVRPVTGMEELRNSGRADLVVKD